MLCWLWEEGRIKAQPCVAYILFMCVFISALKISLSLGSDTKQIYRLYVSVWSWGFYFLFNITYNYKRAWHNTHERARRWGDTFWDSKYKSYKCPQNISLVHDKIRPIFLSILLQPVHPIQSIRKQLLTSDLTSQPRTEQERPTQLPMKTICLLGRWR